MKHIVRIGVALFLTGCTVNVTWSKPGATTPDFNADSYACQKDMYQTTDSAQASVAWSLARISANNV